MAPRPTRLALLTVPVALALALAGVAAAVEPPPASGPHPPSGSTSPTADDIPAGAVVSDERIYQLQRVGDRVYAMGYFTQVGRYAGPGATLSAATGQPTPSPQIADGQVSVTVSDGAGGWYLGGDFTRIGGQQAGGLAHVLADGSLDTAFLPVTDGLVSAVALVGTTLYVGGDFDEVGGLTRQRLAAVSTVNGAVLPFNAPQPTRVTELLAGTGVLYVASDKLTALDPTTGAAVPTFAPTTATTGSPITALALGGGRLYVGARSVVALDPATGAVDSGFDLGEPMAVDTTAGIYSMLYTADRLYLGADRTLIQNRPGLLVAVDPATGAIDPTFAPAISTRSLNDRPPGVYDLALDGDHLWAGGSFAAGLTVVDAGTGAPVDLDVPSYNLQVNAVDLSGDNMYVGGHYFMTDFSQTKGLAAFDADTLDPVPGFHANTGLSGDLFVGAGAVWIAPTHFWGYNPMASPTGPPYYTTGTYSVQAFDPDTGARKSKRSMQVTNLTGITTIGKRLYVARRLENYTQFPRNRIDVYGASGKRVDSYRVQPRGYITQLSSIGGDLVVAGSFVGSRTYWTSNTAMLRLNPANGRPRVGFDPYLNGPVYDVAHSKGGLIATGLFNEVQDVFSFFGKRPGMSRMRADSRSVGSFKPASTKSNLVLTQVHPLGDVLWVPGSANPFLDATTGKAVADPIGWENPGWITGTAGDLTYTDMIGPNLGGRTSFRLGFVVNAD